MKKYKLFFTVPETHTELVLQAVGDAGAGIIGNYSHCSYIVKGVGRFLPIDGASPTIGTIGRYEQVLEDQVQVDLDEDKVEKVMEALKKAHPYEEIAYDLFEKITL